MAKFISKFGENVGIPFVNAYIQFARFTAYTPLQGELYWTVSEATTQQEPRSTLEGLANIQIDPGLNYMGPPPKNLYRNCYVEGLSELPSEELAFDDSDKDLERDQRVFVRTKPTFLNEQLKETFFDAAPDPKATTSDTNNTDNNTEDTVGKPYDSTYEGARYRHDTHYSDDATNATFQVINQKNTGSKTPGTLTQKKPFLKSQEFTIRFKVDAPRQPDTKSTKVLGQTGNFLAFEFGEEKDTRDYWLMFPYNSPAFMQIGGAENTRGEAPSEAADFWTLNNNTWYTLTVSDMRNRITIQNDACPEFPFTYPPDKLVQSLNENLSEKIDTENIESISSPSMIALKQTKQGDFNLADGHYLPGAPIKIHHRGLSFSVHVEPQAFAYPEYKKDSQGNYTDEEGNTIDPSIAEKSPIVVYSPPVFASIDQVVTNIIGSETADFTQMLPGLNQLGVENDPKTFGSHTRTNISINDSIKIEPQLIPLSEVNKYDDLAIELPDEAYLYIWAYRLKVTFNRIKPSPPVTEGGGTNTDTPIASSRFFRTKLYGIRTVARIKSMPIRDTNIINLTRNVKSLSYQKTHEGYTFIRQNYNLDLLVPKKTGIPHSSIPRTGANSLSWEKIERNPAWISLTYGWDRGSKFSSFVDANAATNALQTNFVGMTLGGSISYTDKEDILHLQCGDMINVLEQTCILNSPFYDGMSLPYAVASVLERAGFKSFNFVSDENGKLISETIGVMFNAHLGTYQYTLPYSGLFSKPALKFQNGTKFADIIRQMSQRFYTVFYTDKYGVFHLRPFSEDFDTLNPNPVGPFVPTNEAVTKVDSLGRNIAYYSMPDRTDDCLRLIFNKKTTEVDIKNEGWGNVCIIQTIDKYTGNLHSIQRTDYQSIFNPNAPNFLGFIRMFYSDKGGLGGRAEAERVASLMMGIYGAPRTKVSFEAWGDDEFLPLDIIKVDNNKIRVTSISGEIERSENHWKINVTGDHYGKWNPDEDTTTNIRPVYNFLF